MVLKLKELLIKNVAIHLPSLPGDLCQRLTADQRQRILKWLAAHDRFSFDVIPFITKNIFSTPLHSLEFYKCSQLTNSMLISFANATSLKRLKTLIIHNCEQVDGRKQNFFLF